MTNLEFFAWTFLLALLFGFIGYSAYVDEPVPVQLGGRGY